MSFMTGTEQGFEKTQKIKIHTSSFLLFVRIIIAILVINCFAAIIIAIFWYTVSFFSLRSIIEIIVIILLYIFWSSNHYRLTPYKIVHKQGIIFINQDSYNIETIDNVSCNQGPIWRIFNYWSIVLCFAWKDVVLKNIPNPNYFSSLITKYNKYSNK